MKCNAIKNRAVKALTLLSVYVMSTAGAALLALTCHCSHLHAHAHDDEACHVVACCCGHDHPEHEALCGRSCNDCAVQLAARCCRHNHSTDTELYTADDDHGQTVRIAATDTAVSASENGACVAPFRNSARRFADSSYRLPQECAVGCRPLRAPPACA